MGDLLDGVVERFSKAICVEQEVRPEDFKVDTFWGRRLPPNERHGFGQALLVPGGPLSLGDCDELLNVGRPVVPPSPEPVAVLGVFPLFLGFNQQGFYHLFQGHGVPPPYGTMMS